MNSRRKKQMRTNEAEKKHISEGQDDTKSWPIQAMCAAMLRLLQKAKDKFNADGRCLPQAYIFQPDGGMCHSVGAAKNFDAERFADRLEQKVAEVDGIGILSFGESWMVANWDGVDRVSKNPDRVEVLTATVEAGGLVWLYAWPISRDASGIPSAGDVRPPTPCETGLFRLRRATC